MTQDALSLTSATERIPQHWYDFINSQPLLLLVLRIGFTLITAYVIYFLARHVLVSLVLRVMNRTLSRDRLHETARQKTVIRLVEYTMTIVIWVIAGLMVMGMVGLDVRPLLAGAGVAGLAIGFGAQYLVKDIISGFFIILENQYRVGDVACVGTICGAVEDVTLRKTVLRDMNGTLHHVPNGEIRQTSNMTRDYAKINIDFRLPLDVDLETAYAIINDIGSEMAKDQLWQEKIRVAAHVLRVEEITDSAVIVKIVGETAAGAQWDVAGEMRRQLVIALHKKGVGPAYPRRLVFQEDVTPAAKKKQ